MTILGPAGAGKTRLALHAAATLRQHFSDGVVFVDLAALTDSATIAPAIATALGVAPATERDAERALQTHLSARRVLLVLDTMEHLLSSADVPSVTSLVTKLLHEAPGLTLLITSRKRLRLQMEWTVELSGLSLVQNEREMVGEVPDAVMLFVERARRVAPSFSLDASNREAVHTLCDQLDGLPLAIELAAAQVSFLPPILLLARRDQLLTLLEGGPHDVPARHRTMRAAIDWSYRLLQPEQRALFRALSRFTGGFSLEVAEATARYVAGTSEALTLLRSLVDQSLVILEVSDDDVARYRLMEPFRQYGAELLVADGEAEGTPQTREESASAERTVPHGERSEMGEAIHTVNYPGASAGASPVVEPCLPVAGLTSSRGALMTLSVVPTASRSLRPSVRMLRAAFRSRS